jgi:hypothetical protein
MYGSAILAHLDGGLHARRDAALLQGVLQGQGVHHRGEHAHVVGGGAVHPRGGAAQAAEDVAAADHEGELHAEGAPGVRELVGQQADGLGVEAEAALLGAERLARHLQQDASVAEPRGGRGRRDRCGRRGWSSWRPQLVTERPVYGDQKLAPPSSEARSVA